MHNWYGFFVWVWNLFTLGGFPASCAWRLPSFGVHQETVKDPGHLSPLYPARF